jgi:hypothetical protein
MLADLPGLHLYRDGPLVVAKLVLVEIELGGDGVQVAVWVTQTDEIERRFGVRVP